MAIAHPNDHPQSPRHRREPRGPTGTTAGRFRAISDRRRNPGPARPPRAVWSDAVQRIGVHPSLPAHLEHAPRGPIKNRPRPSPRPDGFADRQAPSAHQRRRHPSAPCAPVASTAQTGRRTVPSQRRPERGRPSAPFRKNGKNGRPESKNVKPGRHDRRRRPQRVRFRRQEQRRHTRSITDSSDAETTTTDETDGSRRSRDHV